MTTLPFWPQSTIVCMASGPSLCQDDVDACRGHARVIAVNDAWRLAPWADVLYSSDRKWFPFHAWVPAFSGLKVVMDLTHDGVVTLRHTGHTGLEVARHGLRSYSNSGGAAINLAMHLGAARVLLLGYDMSARVGDHFFGRHPTGLTTSTDLNYRDFRREMATMVAPLQARGVDVVNCSRVSALECFPRMALADALTAVPA